MLFFKHGEALLEEGAMERNRRHVMPPMSTGRQPSTAMPSGARPPARRRGWVVRLVVSSAPVLFLGFACATGESIDTLPSRLSFDAGLRDASHGHAGDVGEGGGNLGNGGAGNTGPVGNGGATTGSGGTGEAPGSGGVVAGNGGARPGSGGSGAGGKQAGGTTSGGAPSGGASTGGAPSGGASTGGRASGGAQNTGGTGGTMGTGGGSGGAMQCPSYPTNDACSTCICKNCATEVASCYASSDSTKNAQCKTIQDCAEANHCTGATCYCGPNNPLCIPVGGQCANQINAAAGGGANALQIQQLGMDTTNPIGRANAIGSCSQASCKSECGL